MKKYSENGLTVTKGFESLVLSAYPDPASELGKALTAKRMNMHRYHDLPGWQRLNGAPWTIGYGHTGPEVKPGLMIMPPQADAWLIQDVAKAAELLAKSADVDKLTQGQFDCLVDMIFNMGNGFVIKDQVVGDFDDKLRALDFAAMRAAIPTFRRASGQVMLGLVRRRAADLALWDGKDGKTALAIGQAVK